MKKDSRVKAVISLDAVEHNFREMRKNIAEETKMIAVIKADAYGHGAVPVAHLIEDYDYIWGFAAATAEEAIHLREAGITKPILILGIVFDEYFPELVRYEIRPAVCEYEEARKLSDEAVLQKKTVLQITLILTIMMQPTQNLFLQVNGGPMATTLKM